MAIILGGSRNADDGGLNLFNSLAVQMEPLKIKAAWAGVSAAVFLGEHQPTVDFRDAETFEVLGGRNVFDELTYGAPLRRKGLSEEQIWILKTRYQPELGIAA